MTYIFFRCGHKCLPRYPYDYTHAHMFFFLSLVVMYASWTFPFLSYIDDGTFPLFLIFFLPSYFMDFPGLVHHLWDFPSYGFSLS